MDKRISLPTHTKVSGFYPYRTARVTNAFLEFPRDSSDACISFEHKLATAMNVKVDNHVVYQLCTPDGSYVYIACSDFKYRIGTQVLIGYW